MELISLAALSLPEIEKNIYPFPRYHAQQIYKWITRGVQDFNQMTDIPFSLRDELKKNFCILSSKVISSHEEANAKKIVLLLKDGLKTESVLLNDGKNRLTACLSTQAGCPVGCVFCKTGALGFKRNLNFYEITEQLIHLRAKVKKESSINTKNTHEHNINNIVIMGMGEPLLNLHQLRKAITVFTESDGMNISKRRITISTCGIYDSMFDIAKDGPFVRLALSLATADEKLRQKLMPAAEANPLHKIKEAMILFQQKSSSRITLEIPLLGGINTREKDAVSIADFAKGMDTVLNIIPWNPVAGLEFEGRPLVIPDRKEIYNFTSKLKSYGLKVTTRMQKGVSIMGACGQLGENI
jgi:23S rRNA (adenine2503-C2)-methyltransferase